MRRPFTAGMPHRFGADLLLCLRFYTRLPVPTFAFEARDGSEAALGRALRFAPLAGALVGGIGAAALALGTALGLPSFPASLLGLLALVAASGGLHEDGLADVADGFGGGHGRERKLEIMRDSRVGSYGVLAIAFSLLLRAGALAGILDRHGAGGATAALIAAGAVSRGFGLLPMALLPAARADGLGFEAQEGERTTYVLPVGLALLFGVAVPVWGGLGWGQTGAAVLLSLAGSLAVTHLSNRQIGGHTGDVAGAAQQASEVGFLLGLLFTLRVT